MIASGSVSDYVFSAVPMFIFLGLINKEYYKFEISLLAPIDLIENLDQKFLKYFYKVEKFDPKVKNLLSFKSFYNISIILVFIVIFSVSTTSILEKKDKIYHWWGINSYKGSFESKEIPVIANIKNNGLSNELDIINEKIRNCNITP